MAENMEINDVRRVQEVLDSCRGKISAVKARFSYINRLFTQFGPKAEAVLLCHIIQPQTATKKEVQSPVAEASALDVTGSPLEHTFGDDSFNVTILPAKKNWLKDEETHYPYSRRYAAELLNIIQERITFDETWTLPIFALSDEEEAEDDVHVVLMGTHEDGHYWTPMRVTVEGTMSTSHIGLDFATALSRHVQDPCYYSNENFKVTVSSTHELFGSDYELEDPIELHKSDFKGYLKIETTWNQLSFQPPTNIYSSTLTAQVVCGSKDSLLNEMWNEISLLDSYLKILNKYRSKNYSSRYSVMSLDFPSDFSSPFAQTEDILERLNRLLCGDQANCILTDELLDENVAESKKLTDVVKEVRKRPNRDFTDEVWHIVRGANDYMKMTDCIHAVFEAITANNCNPMFANAQDTRLAEMISQLDTKKPTAALRAGSLSLELVIDAGMQKISRDYAYLLSTMHLNGESDLSNVLPSVSGGSFDIPAYKSRLMGLTQIHVALEFVRLVQDHLKCRPDILDSIFQNALKKYSSNCDLKYENFLDSKSPYMLSIPTAKEFISEIGNMLPTSRMSSIKSGNRDDQLTTIDHYSQDPIFPPNIYSGKVTDSIVSENEQVYHVTRASVKHFRNSE